MRAEKENKLNLARLRTSRSKEKLEIRSCEIVAFTSTGKPSWRQLRLKKPNHEITMTSKSVTKK